jgi:hypothetical protein
MPAERFTKKANTGPGTPIDRAALSLTDIAWSAGFMDGEGSMTLVRDSRRDAHDRRNDTLRPRMNGYNTNPEPLFKLQSMYGGTVRPVARKSRPRNQKAAWVWSIANLRAIEAAEIMSPFLTIKKPHAQLLSAFRQTMRYGRNHPNGPRVVKTSQAMKDTREGIRAQLSELAKREYAVEAI